MKKLPRNEHPSQTDNPTSSKGKVIELKNTRGLLSIGKAAKLLSVSVDTLRNWEKSGKLVPVRTTGGVRKYRLSEINKLTKASVSPSPVQVPHQAPSAPKDSIQSLTQSLDQVLNRDFNMAEQIVQEYMVEKPRSEVKVLFNHEYTQRQIIEANLRSASSPLRKLTNVTLTLALGVLLATLAITAGYLTQPTKTTQLMASLPKAEILNNLSGQLLAQIAPLTAAQLGFVKEFDTVTPGLAQLPTEGAAVLAEQTASGSAFLEVNANAHFTGNVTAPNLITGLIAGNNIAITPGVNPTISAVLPATVVTSLNTNSAAITIKAGTDISLTTSNNVITLSNTSDLSTVRGRGGCGSCITDADTTDDLVIDATGSVSGAAIKTGLLGVSFGGTGLQTYAVGDLIYASAGSTLSRLAVGTAGYVLTVSSAGVPAWQPGGCPSCLTQVPSSNTDGATGSNSVYPSATGVSALIVLANSTSAGSPDIFQLGSAFRVGYSGDATSNNTLYFANGSTYKIDSSGNANLLSLENTPVGTTTTAAANFTSIGATTVGSIVSTALTSTGNTSLATNAGSNVTLGNSGTPGTFALSSTGLNVTTAGAISGANGISNSGAYTQSGTSANTFTGTATFSNATYSALFSNGNVGAGDSTPTGFFTVGNGDLFTIDSSGAITAATGITSSGTITFSGVTNAGNAGVTHSSSNGTVTSSPLSLTADVTGALPIANGGTGTTSTPTSGQLLIGNSSNGYTVASLTDGNNIVTTLGSGTISIATSLTPTFTTVNALTQTSNSDGFLISGGTTPRSLTVTGSNITLTGGGNTLTLTGSGTLNQDLRTTASPSFSSLTLTATSNQLVLGTTRTVTLSATTPVSGSVVYTIPDFGGADSFTGLAATQTLTNKSISGSTNTFTNIANGSLSNASFTLTAGTGLSGGGTATLGGSAVTFNNTGVLSITGTANQVTASAATGAVTLSLPQSIGTSSTPQFAGLTLTSTLTMSGATTDFATASNEDLVISPNGTGKVGIATTSPTSLFSVGSSSQFQIDSSGNLAKINNVAYTWPSSVTDTYMLRNNGSGTLTWVQNGPDNKWSSLADPNGNLAISMAAYTSTFTSGSTTGSSNLWTWTDTTSNTGTGYLVNVLGASSSSIKPFHVGTSSVDSITVASTGAVGIGNSAPTALFSVGSSDRFQVNSSGQVTFNPSSTTPIANISNSVTSISAGSIGTWATISTLPALTDSYGAITYNGYVYVFGGYNGSSNLSTVYSAQVKADGTIGSWATLNTLPATLQLANLVTTSQGYVFVVGGFTSSYVSTVYSAKLLDGGIIGTWNTLNTLPALKGDSAVTSYNGYLFAMGGNNGSAVVSTVYSAKVNGNGTIGTWATLNTLPAIVAQQGLVAANGYVFSLGGSSAQSAGTTVSTVYSAPIKSDGTIGTWATLNTLPVPLWISSAVYANGYIYVLGGTNTAGTIVSTVYSAQVKADGTIGSWSTLNTMPETKRALTAVAASGYLLSIGGQNNAGTRLSTIYSAPLGGTNLVSNTSSTFATGNLLDLWNNSAAKLTVDYAGNITSAGYVAFNPLNSGNTNTTPTPQFSSNLTGLPAGSTGTYQTLANLPAIQGWYRATSYNGYLFVAGGYNGGSLSTVYSAKVNADGTINPWQTLNTLPALRDGASSIAVNGYLFVVGGYNGGVVSTVYSAKILDSGTIGSWSTLNTMAQVSYLPLLATAQGYIFRLGGSSDASNSGAISTVYSAQVLGNGTLGTWATLNTLPSKIMHIAGGASNDYLYVTGGIDSGSTALSTVYSAAVKSDGTIGSWSALNTLPIAIYGHQSAVGNGYLYVVGGLNSIGGQLSTVYSSQLKSDGTIGTWATLNTMAQRLYYSGVTITNGYLFIIGGTNGSAYTSTVYSTPIQSNNFTFNASALPGATTSLAAGSILDFWNGNASVASLDYSGKFNSNVGVTLNQTSTTPTANFTQSLNGLGAGGTGTYQTLANLPKAIEGHVVTAYNGYVYLTGGYDQSVSYSTAYSAKVNADGTLGPWTSLTTMPKLLSTHAAVATNGYLFLIGGGDQTIGSTVYSAQILNDGTIGNWNTLTNMPVRLYYHSVAVYNGYLFITGGDGGGGTVKSTVYSAQISGNGTLSAWSTLNTLPVVLEEHSSVAYNGYLYVFGGTSAGIVSTVYSAPIKNDGTIGTWATLNTLPALNYQNSVVAYNGYLYLTGGSNPVSTVYSAQILSDGTISKWAALNNLPGTRMNHSSVISNGYLFVTGGASSSGVDVSTVYSTPLLSDAFAFGTTNTFTAGNLLDIWNNNSSKLSVDYSGNIVAAGATLTAGKVTSQINGIAPGGTGSYSTLSNLPTTIYRSGMVSYNGYIYVVAGNNGSADISTVYSARSNADGTIGSWNTLNTLPVTVDNFAIATTNGYLFILGGNTSTQVSTVYSTKINDNGTIGTWNTLNTLPTVREEFTATAYNGYIYIAGGWTGAVVSTVYSVSVNGNGTIGTWATLNTLPALLDGAAVIATNGYLFIAGGSTTAGAGGAVSTVYSAQIKADGTIGTWATLNTLPQKEWIGSIAAYNNSLYYVGGQNSGSAVTSTVYSTKISADGTVGVWSVQATLPQLNWQMGAIVANSYLYIVGGEAATSGSVLSTVYSTPLQSDAFASNTTSNITAGNLIDVINNGQSLATVDYAGRLGSVLGVSINSTSTTPTANITQSLVGLTQGATGTYSTLANLPARLRAHAVSSSNGYIYVTGGYNGSSVVSTVYSTKVNADGTIGAWIALNTLPAITQRHASTIFNGYLYIVGGHNGSASVSTVYAAKLNNDGTIGNWNTLNTLPAIVNRHSAIAANGYLFSAGGTTDGSTYISTVYSAPINSNGTIGTWATLNTLPYLLSDYSLLSSNGFIHAVAGVNRTAGAYTSTVYSAPIKADGTIGSWTVQANTLPQILGYFGSAIFNNSIYVVAGYSSVGSSEVSTVYSASINSSGIIGSWAAMNTIPAINEQLAVTAINGYLFSIGGSSDGANGVFSTVYSAPLQSDAFAFNSLNTMTSGSLLDLWNSGTSKFSVDYAGILNATGLNIALNTPTPTANIISTATAIGPGGTGSYSTLNNLPAVTYFNKTFSYNGYLFVIAGCNASCSVMTSNNYSAKINADGTVGSWVSITAMPTILREHGLAVYNGYVFVTGGVATNGGTTTVSTVYSSKINSDGTIGSWNTLNTLPVVLNHHASVAHKGYLFVIGGSTASSDASEVSTVYSAPINSNGTVGTWQTLSTLPVLLYQHASVAYNGYIFVLGGRSVASVSTVYSAFIKPDGTIGSWSTLTAMPIELRLFLAVEGNGYIYAVGGQNDQSALAQSNVYSAQIKSDGTVGVWAKINYIPQVLNSLSGTTSNGYLFITGGNGPVSTVYSTPLQTESLAVNTNLTANGALMDFWNNLTSVAGIDYAGRFQTNSGIQINQTSTTPTANLVSSVQGISAGTTGSYQTVTALPQVVNSNSMTTYNGYLYNTGGVDASGSGYSTNYAAKINADGTIGPWVTLTNSPTLTYRHIAAASNGYLFIIGGNGAVSTVYSAQIKADGTIGVWSTLNTLPAQLDDHAGFAYNGYLYVFGGYNGAASLSTVYSAQINGSGTLGAWQTLNTLPQIMYFPTAVAHNGYVYVTGGFNSTSSLALSTVYSAPLKPDGTIGSWQTLNTLPILTNNHTSVAFGGYLYVFGGSNNTTIRSTAYSAQIKADGTIGVWATLNTLPAVNQFASAVVANGYIFMNGGCTTSCSSPNVTSTVYSTPLQSTAMAFNSINTLTNGNLLDLWNNSTSKFSVDYAGNVTTQGTFTTTGTGLISSNLQGLSSGNLGTWNTLNTLPVILHTHAVTTYNGYIYALGGHNGSYVATVYYAKANSDGTTGAWASTTALPAAAGYIFGSAIAYNGYMYQAGGFTGSISLSTVYSAKINDNGTLGSWNTLNTLPQIYSNGTLSISNGYLFQTGGCNTACASGTDFYSTVYSAPLLGNGTIGTWQTLNTVPTRIHGHIGTAYNGYLYVAGGWNASTAISTVYSAPINNNGTIGTWATLATLPVTINSTNLTAFNNTFYIIGGGTCNGCAVNTTYSATIYPNGTTSPWTSLTTLPAAIRETGSAIVGGYIYLVGGQTSANLSTVYSAGIQSDAFALGANPVNGSGTNTALTAGNLLDVWNNNSAVFNVTSTGKINTNTGIQINNASTTPTANMVSSLNGLNAGTTGIYQTLSPLPAIRAYHASVSYNGYIYIIGGQNAGSPGELSTVYSAKVNADGTISGWTAMTALPVTTSYLSAVAVNGYIIIMGGVTADAATLLSTAYSAKINSDGTLGSWNTLSTMPTLRYHHRMSTYNGYIFVTGGLTTAAAYTSTVYSVPVNGNGTIGTWQTLATLPAIVGEHGSLTYNGYLYQLGGHNGSAAVSTVYAAPIKADGTIGTWATLNTLPALLYRHQAMTYNGYIFVIGGNNGAVVSTAYSAQINADGSIGKFTTLNTLPIINMTFGAVVSNGYIFVTGGSTGSIHSSVYSVPLQSDAFAFNSTNPFTAGNLLDVWNNNSQIASVDYSGRLVSNTGVQFNATSTGAAPVVTSNVNAISPGSTGTWQTLTNLPKVLEESAVTTYNGYIYIFGGYAGGADVSVTYSAKISSDGTIGSWQTLNTLPALYEEAQAVAYNGYIYLAGGYATAVISTVYSAKIVGDGTIGVWNTLNTLPALVQKHALIASNGYLFSLGGTSNAAAQAVSTVYSAPINGNGTIGTWATLNTLAALTFIHTATAYNGYIFVIGGQNSAGTNLSTVYSAVIKTDGTIGTWATLNTLPALNSSLSAVAYNGYLYVVGGQNAAYLSTVHSAQIKADGTLGPWASLNTIPQAIDRHKVVASNGYIFLIGGEVTSSGTSISTVYSAPVQSTAISSNTTNLLTAGSLLDLWNNGQSKLSVDYSGNLNAAGGVTINTNFPANSANITSSIGNSVQGVVAGGLGTWQTLNVFPQGRSNAAGVVYNGYIFSIGGVDGALNSTVYSAKANTDGTINPWVKLTAYPTTTQNIGAVVVNGYIFATGGNDGSTSISTVYSSKISDNGTIGSWNTLTALPVTLSNHTLVTYNNYIYAVGGYTGASTYVSTIYSVQVNGNGTIGTWATLNTLPAIRSENSSVVYNGYLYVTGGQAAGTAVSTVYSIALRADGTIGTNWATLTALPIVIVSHSAIAINGYLYVVGGSDTSGGPVYYSTVYAAKVNGDGTIGAWTNLNTLPAVRSKLSTVVANGYLFAIGGKDSANYNSSVYSAQIQSTSFAFNNNSNQSSGNLLDLWNNLTSKFSVDYAGNANTAGGLTINPASTTPTAQFASSIDGITAGSTGNYSTLSRLPVALTDTATATYNGYLFVTGGSNSGDKSTVYSSKINADGTIGAWIALNTLPQLMSAHTAVAYQGYLFISGGTNTSTILSTVYSAKINTDGTIGTWATLNTLAAITKGALATAYNGYLYVGAGCTLGSCTTYLSTLYSAPILADGKIGTWATLSTMPAVNGFTSGVAANGYLFMSGGAVVSTIYSVRIKDDGTVGTWATLNTLPQTVYSHAMITYNSYLYILGGNGSVGNSLVYSAKINTDGTIGKWAILNNLPGARAGLSAAAANGYVYAIGGVSGGGGTEQSTVYAAPLQSTAFAFNTNNNLTNGNLIDVWNQGQSKFNVDYAGNLSIAGKFQSVVVPQLDGTIGTWQTLNTLPALNAFPMYAVYNGYLFMAGGTTDGGTTAKSTVYSAKINTDGTIGTWQTLNTLPALRLEGGSVAYNNNLYIIAGVTTNAVAVSTVYSAPIKPDGTIGTWKTLTTFPTVRNDFGTAAANGYLYVVGGHDGAFRSTVYYSKLNEDGTIGAWSTTTALSVIAGYNRVVTYGGYLYSIAGYNGGYVSTIYSAPLKNDGTLGSWATLNTLPAITALHNAVAYDGYLYIFGGTGGATHYSTVYSAALKNDGTIGTWSTLATLPIIMSMMGAGAYNGNLFLFGGYDGTTYYSTVYSTSLTTSRAFTFNTTNTYPEGTSLGGSASLFTLQNNGDARFNIDAQGNGKFLGTINAAGAVLGTAGQVGDLAENIAVEDESIEAGDLVAAYPGHQGLIKTQAIYDQKVIGIISTKASITFSPETEKGRPVALAGRVPVKVSMQNGLIKAGDWLTSSSTPGVAMKATKPGPMIGQALEDQVLNNEKVLAFVSLSYADPNSLLSKLSLDEDGTVVASSLKTSKLELGSLPTTSPVALNDSNLGTNSTQTSESVDLRTKLAALDTGYAAQAIDIEQLKSQVLGLQSDQIASATAKLDTLDDRLKDPTTLFATQAATLAGLNVSDRVSVASLSSFDATVSGIFKSLGESFLTRSIFNSDVTVDGTFSFTGGNAINAIGTLFVQNSTLSKLVDFVNGKVTISDTGLVKATGTVTAPEVNTKRLVITGPSIGSAKITQGNSSITIETDAVEAGSKVFVTAIGASDKTLSTTNIQIGHGFDVVTNGPVGSDLQFNWVLVKAK